MKTLLLSLSQKSNSLRWSVNKKVHQLILFFNFLLLWPFGMLAQKVSEHSIKAEKEKQNYRVTATTTEFSSFGTNHKEFEIKINNLLMEVRKQLANDSNKEWFIQNLEKSLRQKVEQVCPNIPVLNLMFINEPFVCTPDMDKQELLYAIEFLNVSINAMLTK